MNNLYLSLTMILMIGLVGRNLPDTQATTNSPNEAFTQAAETVVTELTKVASLASVAPIEPTDTATSIYSNPPFPTNTPTFTPTNNPVPCNLVSFVSDLTYLHNTLVVPNQTFIKIWRIRNMRSCSWNSNYMPIFDQGDGLGVTAGNTQAL
ncbi:MAG: hypothetical protein ABSA01_07610 [Anaerolineales bacterium]|jgi:hypothetical protein